MKYNLYDQFTIETSATLPNIIQILKNNLIDKISLIRLLIPKSSNEIKGVISELGFKIKFINCYKYYPVIYGIFEKNLDKLNISIEFKLNWFGKITVFIIFPVVLIGMIMYVIIAVVHKEISLLGGSFATVGIIIFFYFGYLLIRYQFLFYAKRSKEVLATWIKEAEQLTNEST